MSAPSGILPNAATLAVVDDLRKHNTKMAYATFKVQGEEVVPDIQSDANQVASWRSGGDENYAKNFSTTVWPAFVKAIEGSTGPRFSVIDFAYTTGEGRIIRQLVHVAWCPDKGTPARVKMAFASTKTAFENRINIGKKYAANDFSDLEYSTVFDTVTQK